MLHEHGRVLLDLKLLGGRMNRRNRILLRLLDLLVSTCMLIAVRVSATPFKASLRDSLLLLLLGALALLADDLLVLLAQSWTQVIAHRQV